MEKQRLYRFSDLKAHQIVRNWPQLRRLVEQQGFPSGYYLSPQARVWDVADVEAWLAGRKAAAETPAGAAQTQAA